MSDQEKIVYTITHAGEDPDRCSIPFVLANAALAMDVEAVVVLQSTGVFLAQKGYADHVHAPGLPPMKELLSNFVELGGRILVCGPCIKERDISEADFVQGASVTAAGALTQELLTANATLVY